MDFKKRLIPYILAVPFLFNIYSCGKKESPTEPIANRAPVIERIIADPSEPFTDERVTLECRASDEDINSLSYTWEANEGELTGSPFTKTTNWIAPSEPGEYSIFIRIADKDGLNATGEKRLTVDTRFDTVYVSEDGYVNSTNPDWVSQTSGFESYALWVLHRSDGNERSISYYKFNFNNIKGNIKSAKLVLDNAGWGEGSPDHEGKRFRNPGCYLHDVIGYWNEYGLSYNNQPMINPTARYTITLPEDPSNAKTFSYDITELAKEGINSESKIKSFSLIPHQQMEGGYAFMSKEGIKNWPQKKIPMIITEKEH